MRKLGLLLAVFVAPTSLTAYQVLGASAESHPVSFPVPDDIYLPDFSYAGYGFGEVPIPAAKGKVIDLLDYGVVADDEKDDSKGFLAALDAANRVEGPVIVALPRGRIIVSEILPITRSDIVIKGHGRDEGGSTVFFPRPLAMIGDAGRLDELREYLIREDKRQVEPERNIDFRFSEYSWSGGFFWVGREGLRPESYLEELDPARSAEYPATNGKRGKMSLTVGREAALRLKAGDWIKVIWRNAEGKDGPLIVSIYGDTDLEIGSRLWSSSERELVAQKTRILSVKGDRIVIGDPLMHDANSSIKATIQPWHPLTDVGFEDFRLEFPDAVAFGHHLERGYNGIYITGTANGWARNLNMVNPDSGILTYDSANLTLANINFLGDRYGHYAVHLGSVHNVLVEKIEIRPPVEHSFTFNTKSTRSVYKDVVAFNGPVLDQHAGANHQNLFDQVTMHIDAKKGEKGYYYPAFNGSGAPYWEPGHGRFNTTWNLSIIVKSGPAEGEPVQIQGLAEGPDARIIGLFGNRPLTLDYRPAPYVSHLNRQVAGIPSLYDYQLAKRLRAAGK
jgi:hypothetical protein